MKKCFYYIPGNKLGRQSFIDNRNFIDQILFTGLQVKSDGKLLINNGDEKLLSKNKTIEIVPVIQNFKLSNKITTELLKNTKSIKTLVNELSSYLQTREYNKVNVNLEGVKPELYENFMYLIFKLKNKLGFSGHKLELTVPAKTENRINTEWAGAYRYNELADIIERLVIMAYDYHWAGGIPGPIAPLSWVYNVIDYAVMEIPLSKICIALPFYGYDWPLENEKNRARGLSYYQIQNILKNDDICVEWDQESSSPYFHYYSEDGKHEVWYENKASIFKKLNMLNKFNVKIVAFWRLGLEDPVIWNRSNWS